jgi:SAM-dependent methyltransferase
MQSRVRFMVRREPVVIDGIPCYSPGKINGNDGFHAGDFEALYQLEEKSFWFRVRNKIIRHLVGKYLPGRRVQFIEIGCGNGYVLKGLEELPGIGLKGSEIYLEGLQFAKKRLPRIEFIQLDATDMPFESDFDCVGAFDMLEHVEDDEQVMRQVHQSLKEDGIFAITVPQYPWMWTYLDDISCHKRRYTRSELRQKLTKAGFRLLYIGSFVTTLFPAQMVTRLLNKKAPAAAVNELALHPVLNTFCFAMMSIDYYLIKAGIRIPFGGSLVCVAKKIQVNSANH